MAGNPVELQLTGERTLPGFPDENYWFTRHLVIYLLASSMVAGRSVVDFGCGEGYGSAILAGEAEHVLAVDIDPRVIDHARNRYPLPNLDFEVMDVIGLDVDAGSFEVAVSFQVIEHVPDDNAFLSEITRVLAPDGIALLTTPNRYTISPGSDSPINPFHLREYSPGELRDILLSRFERVQISGLFHSGWLRLNDLIPVVDFIKFYSMSGLNPRYWTHRLLTPLVRTSNFRLRDGELDDCLDILAICRVPEKR